MDCLEVFSLNLAKLLNKSHYILAEGAVIERIKRKIAVVMDKPILNAALIYDDNDRSVMSGIYQQYLDISSTKDMYMTLLTPTWRCSRSNIDASGYVGVDVNRDCFLFVDELRSSYGNYARKILIGGQMGVKGDAYKPQEALSFEEAIAFHGYQAEKLNDAGADFLIASTLPALSEALGLAKAMALTGNEYVISFVLRSEGTLLDGTMLWKAIQTIDNMDFTKPTFYMANCVHPSVLDKALKNQGEKLTEVLERFKGLQANTSSKNPEELDGSSALYSQSADEFSKEMFGVYKRYGLKLLGGCCGTDNTHIERLSKRLKEE